MRNYGNTFFPFSNCISSPLTIPDRAQKNRMQALLVMRVQYSSKSFNLLQNDTRSKIGFIINYVTTKYPSLAFEHIIHSFVQKILINRSGIE